MIMTEGLNFYQINLNKCKDAQANLMVELVSFIITVNGVVPMTSSVSAFNTSAPDGMEFNVTAP